MERVTVTASFADADSARRAQRGLAEDGVAATVTAAREGRFMARLVAIVVFWSIIGTGLGAAFGALLSYTVGPHGTEGLVLLVVTWAIFAHVLIGMWAGYVLLSDRSRSELSAGETALTAIVEASAAPAIGARLKSDGATRVTVVGERTPEPAAGG